jgi:hypothetical protein
MDPEHLRTEAPALSFFILKNASTYITLYISRLKALPLQEDRLLHIYLGCAGEKVLSKPRRTLFRNLAAIRTEPLSYF